MPSQKNQKHSKAAASSFSLSSPASPYRTLNTYNEDDEDDFLGALEEASTKFPSLISKSAFIGKVSSDASVATSVLGALDSKGCKIWLSGSAMNASSVAPGSIVSVSLASRKFSSSKPLCSLAEECATSFGFDFKDDLVGAPGYYFALAAVFSSNKNAIRLSSNLFHTMGCPVPGRIVFLYPVCNQLAAGTLNEYDKSSKTVGWSLSLYNCKQLHLSLVSSEGKFRMNSTTSSKIGLLSDITNVQDGNGNISSPRTPLFSQCRYNSSSTSLLHTPNFQESRPDSSNVHETYLDTLDISEILGNDNVRKLLQNCSISWFFSRSLLCGNFVVIPVLSRLCIFLAIGGNSLPTNGYFQNQPHKSNGSLISESPNLANCLNDGFLIDHGTKVHFHLSRDSMPQTPTRKTSSSMAPVHGHSTANKGINFPKLGGFAKEFAVLKEIIVASAVKGALASMGLRPTKGVLLHGPPGTGKTSLAKLCAYEACVNLFMVHGLEIISQYYGESERALHEVFDSASRALPVVVRHFPLIHAFNIISV